MQSPIVGSPMRILLINPPYHAVTSRYGVGEQMPLGLLSIGGPLVDAGHHVALLDAEARHMTLAAVVADAVRWAPDVIMTGHAGSTPAHPTIAALARRLKAGLATTPIVYGGVYPSYHGAEILAAEPAFDLVVRGEGEVTAVRVAAALADGSPLADVPGLFYRDDGAVRATPPAPLIETLDAYRVGWELIEDWDLYRCWGIGRSAIVQLSRGCPHLCSYCGQTSYWARWRHRSPERLAQEIAWLHRTQGVNFVDLADENPTSSRRVWRRFLEALIAHDLPVKLFATVRASDIVRDADILPLYKRAGFECFLMGFETTDPETMRRIRKGSTRRDDHEAVRLLRRHGILSMVGHVAGFEEERIRDYWSALRQLLLYDPDLLNAMYVTPHRWTPFYAESAGRTVVLDDQSKWDYRHQVLGNRHLRPWQVFALVKLTEAVVQLRPRALWRLARHRDRDLRRALRWSYRNAALVWLDEIHDFLFRSRYTRRGRTLAEIWGEPQPTTPALARPKSVMLRGEAGAGEGNRTLDT